MLIHRKNFFSIKCVLITIVSGIIYFPCFAQVSIKDSLTPSSSKSIIVLQPQVHIGKLIKIYPEFPYSSYVNLNELNISFQTRGRKEWHQLYRYPQVGVALFYGYWGNDQVFGRNIGIVPNLAFETHNKKRWSLQTRFGLGFTYFTTHYNAINNPTNNVIGSKVTNLTFLTEDLNYKLSKQININVGISIFHSSDGHYQLPNLGANVPSLNIGIRYYLKPVPEFYKHDSVAKPNKKTMLNLFAGYGRHEYGNATKPTGGPKYPVFQLAIYASKRYKKICNFHYGLSYAYYTDYYDYIINQELFYSNERLNASVITTFLGNEFIIGKFGLIAQSGINIHTPFLKKINSAKHDKEYASVYISNKIGVQYYFYNPTLKARHNIYIGIYMKANFGTADYAQIGVGTTF